MSVILHINTATAFAFVSLSKDEVILDSFENKNQKEHAAWLHPAIDGLLEAHHLSPADLDAVAVCTGPGSYTGLRIGLSAAKGLCYALGIPLIGVNSLEWMAAAVRDEATDLIIPLMEARKDEVFTAVYDTTIREKNSPYALIIQPGCFDQFLHDHQIIFCGNAVKKVQSMLQLPEDLFSSTSPGPGHFALLSLEKLANKQFLDLAYSEPLYVKDVYLLNRD